MNSVAVTTAPLTQGERDTDVRHFRQILLWPLRLIPARGAAETQKRPWQILRDLGDASPWKEVVKEYTGDSAQFHERHYQEFVTFLPYVQRFLYGEPRSKNRVGDPSHDSEDGASSPMRIFRRHDIAY